MNIRCLKCKGRGFCGRNFCPLIAKTNSRIRVKEKLVKEDFFGASPAPFVGRYGYPNINVGILSPAEKPENIWEYDAPKHWSASEYQIPQIIDFRSALINSKFKSHVKGSNVKGFGGSGVNSRMLDLSQEVALASKPVDVEINLKQKPKFAVQSDSYMAPTGPNAVLKKAKITENPKIHTKVDKVFSDTDLKAKDGVLYLYKNEFDENFLSKILSVGTLGLGKNRKLVPTRWSITATDDMIGKDLINKVKDYGDSGFSAYFGGYLGNYYLILFLPSVFSYELFEMYAPKASFNTTDKLQYTTDYEDHNGRKTYADNTAGGYYATRLGILERLNANRRQAGVLALRFITEEYWAPLGVWVVRQATRKALESKPLEFSDKDLLLKYVKAFVKKKFGYDIDSVLAQSKLLRNLKEQRRIFEFI